MSPRLVAVARVEARVNDFIEALMDGGGTANSLNPSPSGNFILECTDVGWVRCYDVVKGHWRYLPMNPELDRHVAAGIVTDEGDCIVLAGNSTSGGRVVEITYDGTVTNLAEGLYVRANNVSLADVGTFVRPRPIGHMLRLDPANNLVYACTEDSVQVVDRALGLAGTPNAAKVGTLTDSCRGFAHNNHNHSDADELFVSTLGSGLVRMSNLSGAVAEQRVSGPGWDRIESAALIPGSNMIVVAAALQGVGLLDGNISGGTPDGSVATVDVTPTAAGGAGATGANGDVMIWDAVACSANGTMMASPVNPPGSAWTFRHMNAPNITAAGWEDATPNPAILRDGSNGGWIFPSGRRYGWPSNSGPGLNGAYLHSWIGDTLLTCSPSSMYETPDAEVVDASTLQPYTFNRGTSMITSPALVVTAGNTTEGPCTCAATADHNLIVGDSAGFGTVQPARVGFSGLTKATDIQTVGSGANELVVFAPSESAADPDTDLFGRLDGGTWTSLGWRAHDWTQYGFGAGVPRCNGITLDDQGGGVVNVRAYAEGVGMMRTTLTGLTPSGWVRAATGPTSVIANSLNMQQPNRTALVGATQTDVFLERQTGEIWRSTDEGVNYSVISPGGYGLTTTNAVARQGYLNIHGGTALGAASKAEGLWRIDDLAGAANFTQITGVGSGMPIFDEQSGVLYHFEHHPTAVRVLEFGNFAIATSDADAINRAEGTEFAKRIGGLMLFVTCHREPGVIVFTLTYQGGGHARFNLPAPS